MGQVILPLEGRIAIRARRAGGPVTTDSYDQACALPRLLMSVLMISVREAARYLCSGPECSVHLFTPDYVQGTHWK